MPERAVTKAAPRRMPASVAPAATERTPTMARKITAMPLPTNANTELPASHMAKVWPRREAL